MLIAAVRVHQPDFGHEIRRREYVENNLLPVGRPRLPKGAPLSQIGELFDTAPVRIHRVNIRSKDERNAPVFAAEGRVCGRRQDESHAHQQKQAMRNSEFHSYLLTILSPAAGYQSLPPIGVVSKTLHPNSTISLLCFPWLPGPSQ